MRVLLVSTMMLVTLVLAAEENPDSQTTSATPNASDITSSENSLIVAAARCLDEKINSFLEACHEYVEDFTECSRGQENMDEINAYVEQLNEQIARVSERMRELRACTKFNCQLESGTDVFIEMLYVKRKVKGIIRNVGPAIIDATVRQCAAKHASSTIYAAVNIVSCIPFRGESFYR